MTRTEMLARVRTLLDESSAGFWTDAEIYSALQDGEYQSLNHLLSVFKALQKQNPSQEVFEVLRPLITKVENLSFGTTGTSTVTLPADFLYDIHVEYDDNSTSPIAAYRRGEDKSKYFNSENSLLASNQSQYYYWIDATNLNFGTAISGTGSYRLTYLKKPTGISSSQDAMIGFGAHEAICFYATAKMFQKDMRINESQVSFSQYIALLRELYY